MIVSNRIAHAIAQGDVTVAYRRWRRARVAAGQQFHTVAGVVRIGAVTEVDDPSALTEADARKAGYDSVDELVATFRDSPGDPVYRIELSWAAPDPREQLANDAKLGDDDIEHITHRLDRLDRKTPWTRHVLKRLAEEPGVVAGRLADELSADKESLKRRVRHLKALGLTLSLSSGYALSPRGEAYREHMSKQNRSTFNPSSPTAQAD